MIKLLTWEWKGDATDDSEDDALQGLGGLVGLEGQLPADGFALLDIAPADLGAVAAVHRHGDDLAAGGT